MKLEPNTVAWHRLRIICNGREVHDATRRRRLLSRLYDDEPLPCGCQFLLPPSPWAVDWRGFVDVRA